MKSRLKKRPPAEIVQSREEAVSKFLDAARNVLADYSDAERRTWAEKTADRYIASGVIAIQPL